MLDKSDSRFALNTDAFEGAVMADSVEILKMLFDRDPEGKLATRQSLFEVAVDSSSCACFKLLRSMGCEWKDEDLPRVAAAYPKRRSLDLLRLILQHHPPQLSTPVLNELIATVVRFAPNFAPFELLLKHKVFQLTEESLEVAKAAIQEQHKPALKATWKKLRKPH